MLNPLSNLTLVINNTSATSVNRNVLHTPTGESLNSAGASSASGVIVSSLAGQLSEAAVRADIREATLDQHALSQKAQALISELVGAGYLANKAAHDAEVPDTDDSGLLARARQATDFLNGNATNPFEDLSREQLSLIAFDESDTFTVNERRAALRAADDQEQAWRQANALQGQADYKATGHVTNTLSDALEHYRSLPVLDRALYPDDFEHDLIAKAIWTMDDGPLKPMKILSTLWDTVKDLFEEDRFKSPQAPGETEKTEPSNTDSSLPQTS